jgi:hypothetical protein
MRSPTAVADGFRHLEHVRGLLARVALVPAVELVGAIAELVAALGKIGEGLR